MVSLRHFAVAGLAASASAITIPSLDTIFNSVSDSAALALEQLKEIPEVIHVFPSSEEDVPGAENDVILGADENNLPKVGLNVFPGADEKPIPGNSPIVNCDIATRQILDLRSVIIEPNPPVKGQNLTFVAQGFLTKDITDGAYVDVDVRYGFIRLVHQTFDLCKEIQNVDLECPVKKGVQSISKSVLIPEEVPPGKYLVNARAYTKDDELITCLTATVEFPAN